MALEIIILNEDDAKIAEASGASRLALATAMDEGGRTPDLAVIERVATSVDIPVRVVVRPDGGSFTYSVEEQEYILETVKEIQSTEVEGIVIGALTPRGEVDRQFLEKIIAASGDSLITFNRAIDNTIDIHDALDVISDYKEHVTHVLTSGGRPKTEDALFELRELMAQTWDRNGPTIMPCASITTENFSHIHRFLYAKNYQIGTGAREERSFGYPLDAEKIEKLAHICG